MDKIRVNMLSMADSVDGQGVGSAYLELIKLLKEDGKDKFEIQINENTKNCDIIHAHTIEPRNYIKMKKANHPSSHPNSHSYYPASLFRKLTCYWEEDRKKLINR